MTKEEIYLEMYKEWRGHFRHHETQRSTVTNAFLAFAGIAIGFLLKDRVDGDRLLRVGASIALMITGFVVCIINQKQYELIQKALVEARCIVAELDRIVPGLRVGDIEKEALQKHRWGKNSFPRLFWQKLHLFWLILPVISIGIGGMFLGVLLNVHYCWITIGATFYFVVALGLYINSARKARQEALAEKKLFYA